MARLEQLQEAALREVIWTLGGSARCLEAAFGGARGILGFEDFVRGLRTIGFQAEDLEGCGFKDPAEAFRVLDRSGRGCLLIEEVTRRPEAKIRKLCGSGSLRRSASSDGFDMSIGSTGSDLYSAREDLENILGLLREREQEIQLLRTEMNSLKEQQDRHSAELLRAQRDLSLHHRSSIEQLQESQRSKDVEEFAHSAEAHHLNEKSRRNSERMLLEEQECLRMEVSRQQCLRVITEAEENMERCRLRHEDSVEYLHSLQEVYAELEVHGAQLKPSQGAALARELRLELEELNTLESQQHTEEAQEAELRNDLRQLRQEVMTSDKHRKELLTTVARGVSELSEELMAQHLSAKSELDLAEKKLSTVKRNTEAKVAELRGIKERMHEARLAAETESKEISQRSKEQVRKTLLESRQRDEEVQEEVVQLEHRHSEFGNGLGFLISEGSARPRLKESGRTMAEAEALRETLQLEKVRREGDRQMRERSQGRQGNAATELPELRAELNAAKERANDLALKCEQTWKKLTQEKRKAAAFAAESFEAAPLSVQPT